MKFRDSDMAISIPSTTVPTWFLKGKVERRSGFWFGSSVVWFRLHLIIYGEPRQTLGNVSVTDTTTKRQQDTTRTHAYIIHYGTRSTRYFSYGERAYFIDFIDASEKQEVGPTGFLHDVIPVVMPRTVGA